MGNASTAYLPTYDCFSDNLSESSITHEYWDSHGLNDSFRVGSIVQAVLMLLFMLIGLPGNAVIIVSIIQQKLYKETTYILLLNLAISDFLVCLLVMPFTIVAGFAGGYIFGDSDYTRCHVCQTGVILTVLSVLSVNILGLISLDRFIFIKFPLRYESMVTIPRVIIAVILAWLLSITEAILPLFGFGQITYGYSLSSCTLEFTGSTNIYYAILLVGLALFPIIVTVVTNIWIACIVQKQIVKIYQTRRSFANREELRKYNQNMRKQIHRRKNKKQLVLIRVFGAILISNLIVWTPIVIFTIVSLIVKEESIPLGFFIFVYISFITHSFIHPLVEGCFSPEIKNTFKKMLGWTSLCKKRKSVKNHTSVSRDIETGDTAEDVTARQSSCTRNCLDMCSFAVLPES